MLDHGENFYKGAIADFKLFQSPVQKSSDIFHMLISYPFEYNERTYKIGENVAVDLPLRVNCTSGELIHAMALAHKKHGEKYEIYSAGSSSMGNMYTHSVRNIQTVPDLEQHLLSEASPVQTKRVNTRQGNPSKVVYLSTRALRQMQQHMSLVHVAGDPHIGPLNLGDGQLSVMLTVAETKLAFIQHLRNQAKGANTAGKQKIDCMVFFSSSALLFFVALLQLIKLTFPRLLEIFLHL